MTNDMNIKEIQEMQDFGLKIRRSYNSFLKVYRETNNEDLMNSIEGILASLEIVANDLGYETKSMKDRKGISTRLSEVTYKGEEARKTDTFIRKFKNNKKWKEEQSQSTEVKEIEPIEEVNKVGKFIYVPIEDYVEFKEEFLSGYDYISEDPLIPNFENRNFVGQIIGDYGKGEYLRIKSRSAYMNYSGWEDYIIPNNEKLDKWLGETTWDFNLDASITEERGIIGRFNFLRNLSRTDMEGYFDKDNVRNEERFNLAVSKILED